MLELDKQLETNKTAIMTDHELPSAVVDSTSLPPAVDSSPINPLQRRDSLEKHLQLRPDAQDLKNRHILLDTTAAP